MARITGQFGEHRSYYKPGRFHEGVDLAFAENSPIKAYGGGKVTFVGFDPNGYGNYMKILADDGTTHLYGHANRFNKKLGDIVRLGDELGLVGQTGRSTGPHIHFGVYKQGKAVDPMDVINQKPQLKQSLGSVNMAVTPQTQDAIANYANIYAEQLLAQNAEAQRRSQELYDNKKELMNAILSQEIKKPDTGINTMEEVLKAPTGLDKANAYLDYLNSPEKIRQITRGLGGYTFDSKLKPHYAGEDWANEVEARNQKLQKQYNSQVEERNKMLFDLMKELGVDTRALDDLGYKYVSQGQNDATKNRDIAETERSHEANEGLKQQEIDANNTVENYKMYTGGYYDKDKGDGTAKEDDLAVVQRQLDEFEKSFKNLATDKIPKKNSYGISKLSAIGSATNAKLFGGTASQARFEALRAPLVTIAARKIAGEKGNMSDRDIARAEKMVPTLMDSRTQKEAKMKALKDLIGATRNVNSANTQTTSNANTNVQSTSDDPLGLGI